MSAWLLIGCGDAVNTADGSVADDAAGNDAPTFDAGVPDARFPDAAPPDARACSALVSPQPGATCSVDGDCGIAGFCLNAAEGWPDVGYCTRTCVFDGACGDGAFCSDDIGDGTRLCLAECCEGDACGLAGNTCQDSLLGLFPLGDFACVPANVSAADGDACGDFADCAPSSFCALNPFETPGGYCITVGCTVGDDSTCAAAGDGTCVNFGDGGLPACVDPCTVPSDCRQSEGYDCIDLGEPIGSFCIVPHEEPGAACTEDGNCGQAPWECLTGASFPGGYCGGDGCDPANEDSCPDGTVCHDDAPGTLDGTEFCAALCDPAAVPSDCRVGEGYVCSDLGGSAFGCIVP